MPLYEYECQACHRRTEKIQKFSEAELTECPHCGGKLERTITAPAFQFAGGGWYKDLYSSAKPAAESGGEAKPGGSETPAAPAGGSSGEGASPPAAAAPSASSAPAPAAPAPSKSGS